MIDKTPQVFISYSWTSEEYKQRVKDLAARLMHDGILVKLDIWDLKDGQDKYVYMEQCVTDENIDKVLILSDRIYAEKADKRKGGVGDETTIISPEIYGHASQQKFIPVVMERDEQGTAYLPAYLKSRMYKDLSGDSFEAEYESLVRTIYDEPAERKPELGSRPAWLDSEPSALYPAKEAMHQLFNTQARSLKNSAAQEFLDAYIEALKPFFKASYSDPQTYLEDFSAMKDARNLFLGYLKGFSTKEHFGSFMADSFEKLYNSLCDIRTFVPDAHSCGTDEFDIFKLHVWELFVCTTAFMLHNELYSDLHEMLYHTYFLRQDGLSETVRTTSYEGFRFHSKLMEEQIKPKMPQDLSRKYTLTGHYMVNDREYLPLYSGKALANADLFLYQVYNGLNLEQITEWFPWFPTLYVYADHYDSVWKKLKSEQFCKKIMPIFGVATIQDLKARLSQCKVDSNVRYSHGFADPAPAILSYIKLDDVGVLP